MYSADMFCFGEDRQTVFITGIRGCMGIVYVGSLSTYAIHIPPDNKTVVTDAGNVFVRFIKNNDQSFGKGRLIGFVNGSNRTYTSPTNITGEEELKIIKRKLGSPKTILYRINKHLGADSGNLGADAVAVQLQRTHESALAPDGCLIYYKRHDDIKWVDGGSRPVGKYKTNASDHFMEPKIPGDVDSGWRYANADNCSISKI